MRIAQIAPLWEAVPGQDSRDLESFIGLLSDELVMRGHDVTLFARVESDTLAWLNPSYGNALLQQGVSVSDYGAYEQMRLSKVFNCSSHFDVIHSHIGYPVLPYAALSKAPVLHTLHEPFTSATEKIFHQHRWQNLVLTTEDQRLANLALGHVSMIPYAIDLDRFRFYSAPQGEYLAYVGAMTEQGGANLVLQMAQALDMPLQLSCAEEIKDATFFAQEVAPYIDGQHIKFFGTPGPHARNELLGNAVATIVTGDDPYGWTTLESLASGTPVLTLSSSQTAAALIQPGVTGYVGETLNDLIAQLPMARELQRSKCREWVADNCTIETIAADYEAEYSKVLRTRPARKDEGRFTLSRSYRAPGLRA